jgi:hypothetical protein
MQDGTKRSMRTHRHGPAVGPFSGRSKGSERKLSRPVGVRVINAKKSYERYMALARAARSAGDAIDRELLPTRGALLQADEGIGGPGAI